MTSPWREEDPLGRIEAAHGIANVATTGTGWRRTTGRLLALAALVVFASGITIGMLLAFLR
ncbi:MAG: hypothetical protein ABR511_09920 [Acidimicrobiales bacterium]